ncbi:hypothetical protein AVEN_178029-1, partial [Araneus ventricosus]
MQSAVIAAFAHTCSSAKNPMHKQCPEGSDSWCKYQRAISVGKNFKDSNAGLPKSIMNIIKRTYMKLCDQKLLEKCLHGKTQNANESFSNVLWTILPKNTFVELQTLRLGSSIAVLLFNDGFSGIIGTLNELARLQLDCSENIDEEAVEQWINEDSKLECCEVLSDDDIVSRATCGSEETRNFEECPESDEENLLCESQLDNTTNGETSTSLPAEDTYQNEPANTFSIYGGPPRKKRKRTETDEILAAATSALKSLGSTQGQSSLYSSIGQVVTFTLETLNGQQQQK